MRTLKFLVFVCLVTLTAEAQKVITTPLGGYDNAGSVVGNQNIVACGGDFVFVVNASGGITRVNTVTGEVNPLVPTSQYPYGVVCSPALGVTVPGGITGASSSKTETVTEFVNPETLNVSQTVAWPVHGYNSVPIGALPDGRIVGTSDVPTAKDQTNKIVVFAGSSDNPTVQEEIPVPDNGLVGAGACFNSSSRCVLATSFSGQGQLVVFDGSSVISTAPAALGASCRTFNRVIISPDDKLVFVWDCSSNQAIVYDGQTLQATGLTPPNNILFFSGDPGLAYQRYINAVYGMDTGTWAVVSQGFWKSSVALGDEPVDVLAIRKTYYDTIVVMYKDRLELWNVNRVPAIYQVVVNGGTFQSGSIAPGQWSAIFARSGSDVEVVGGYPYPSTLDTAQVLVNGVQAPLSYVSPTQINFQMLANLTPGVSVNVQIRTADGNGGWLYSNIVTVPIVATSPVILASVDDTTGQVMTDSTSSASGDAVSAYVTGFGPTTEQMATGQPAPLDHLVRCVNQPTVTVANLNAQVTFCGLAPGLVAVQQINYIMPSLPDGKQQVAVSVPPAPMKTATAQVLISQPQQ